MSVFKYIAESSPFDANQYCVKNGMQDALTLDEISNNLTTLVASGGENTFKDVMNLHPDKEVILELFQQKQKKDDIFEVVRPPMMVQQPFYMNATGVPAQPQSSVVSNTSIMIVVSALIISIAIISLNKR